MSFFYPIEKRFAPWKKKGAIYRSQKKRFLLFFSTKWHSWLSEYTLPKKKLKFLGARSRATSSYGSYFFWCHPISCPFLFIFFFSSPKKGRWKRKPGPSSWTRQAFHLAPSSGTLGSSILLYPVSLIYFIFNKNKRSAKIKREKRVRSC
jgi:hypothetical protein